MTNVIAITDEAQSIPQFKINSLVCNINNADEIAQVRSYQRTDEGTWEYTLSHPISCGIHANEDQLVEYAISEELLQRYAELYMMQVQAAYRRVMQEKELLLSITLNQYSDTHDTVIAHKVVGGTSYGTNNVSLEGDNLAALAETAKWDMHKREKLAPKRLTHRC